MVVQAAFHFVKQEEYKFSYKNSLFNNFGSLRLEVQLDEGYNTFSVCLPLFPPLPTQGALIIGRLCFHSENSGSIFSHASSLETFFLTWKFFTFVIIFSAVLI